jgi:hypothetical protein
MERKIITFLALVATTICFAQFKHTRVYSTFDNLPLEKSDTFNNGADRSGGFSHYGRYFPNTYDTTWKSWGGWSLSNMTDDSTAGFENQYSAKPGHGVSQTVNYAVASGRTYIKLDSAIDLSGAYFTNSTYSYLDMKNGSGFSKKFGGPSGNDSDYFRLIIRCYNAGVEASSVEFYLADFRDSDNSKDYILDDWTFVDFNNDLKKDIKTDSIAFFYESSDVGMWGMNTPATFCMDDFNGSAELSSYYVPFLKIPKDTFYNGADMAGGFQAGQYFFANSYNSTWNSWSGWSYSTMQDDSTAGFENQFSCIDGSSHFYVAGGEQNEIRSVYLGKDSNTFSTYNKNLIFTVNNSTYAYLDMLNGSSFSKKFGGIDGTDPDYFRLLVSFVNSKNELVKKDTIYLADYRFENSEDDYILKDYAVLFDAKASSLEFHKMVFKLESSDNGTWGMNTPAFFCMYVGIRIPGGISDPREMETLRLYPNPVQNELSVVAETSIKSVAVFSVSGKLISETRNIIASKNTLVETHNLTPGIYFVRVQTEKGIATKKFIKQ